MADNKLGAGWRSTGSGDIIANGEISVEEFNKSSRGI